MGLDWVIYTKEGTRSKCEIVKAPRVRDTWPTKEAWLADPKIQGHYRAEWLEKIKRGEVDWDIEHGQKYLCDECPACTERICSECAPGGFGCAAFGFGGCNYRGKTTAYHLDDVPGIDSRVCYKDRDTKEEWKELIDTIDKAIDIILHLPKKDIDVDALKELQNAKYWLEWWFKYVGEGICLNAWY
jgi:hypothetical protein